MDLSEIWHELVPESGDLNEFIASIAEARGRAIRLMDVPGLSVPALVADWNSEFIIAVRPTRNTTHKAHSICHELGHIVHNHTLENGTLQAFGMTEPSQSFLSEGLRKRILGLKARKACDVDPQEREAESTAHAMMRALSAAKRDHVTSRMV